MNDATTPDATAEGIKGLELKDGSNDGGMIDDGDRKPAAVEKKQTSDDAAETIITPTTTSTAAATTTTGSNDANDDNRSTSTTTTADSDDEDDDDLHDKNTVPSTEIAMDRLLQATQLKDEGNDHFKKQELEKASRCYRQGVSKLKPLIKHAETADEQVKACFVALQTNLSMVLFKQKKYKLAVDIATRGLQYVPSNTPNGDASKVKLFYRRAVAHRQLANLETARDDLRLALQVDANNAACRKELAAVKKELETSKQNQKNALAKAFSNSSFLYEDKETEKKHKIEAEKKQKEEEEQLKKKRKALWEDEQVKRMANNQPAISFEDWEKEKEDEKKNKEKEEEKKRKEERRKRREEIRKNNQNKKDDDSDEELTEQELALMRGYKKTKDGRITSYFTREVSEEEKKALAAAPLRLNAPDSTSSPCTPQPISRNNSSDGVASRPSAWNAAGTWEEKDTSNWCTNQLSKRLEETHATTEDLDVDITKIEHVNGHASVALAAGKKRYIFEYDAKLKYTIKNPSATGDSAIIAKGIVKLPDICSTSHDEVEVTFDAYGKKPPKPEYAAKASKAQKQLAHELREQIQRWVRDFNEQY